MLRYFSFNGRARRTTWWQIQVATFLAAAVLYAGLREFGSPMGGVERVLQLLTFAITLPVTVRRAHDRGRPAVWIGSIAALLLALNLGPPAFETSGLALDIYVKGGAFQPIALLMPIYIAVMVYLLVELGILEGTRGPNRYGPSPKDIGVISSAAVFD